MTHIWNSIKNELEFYFNIKNTIIVDLTIIFVFIFSVLITILLVKEIIGLFKLRKERLERTRRIDKLWIELMKTKRKK